MTKSCYTDIDEFVFSTLSFKCDTAATISAQAGACFWCPINAIKVLNANITIKQRKITTQVHLMTESHKHDNTLIISLPQECQQSLNLGIVDGWLGKHRRRRPETWWLHQSPLEETHTTRTESVPDESQSTMSWRRHHMSTLTPSSHCKHTKHSTSVSMFFTYNKQCNWIESRTDTYTMSHKKHASLFRTITPTLFAGFVHLLCRWKQEWIPQEEFQNLQLHPNSVSTLPDKTKTTQNNIFGSQLSQLTERVNVHPLHWILTVLLKNV